MTATDFAAYCRRIRECDNPAALAGICAELDREHPHSDDSRDSNALVVMATLKRVRLVESS
jgi:hypothetical protein